MVEPGITTQAVHVSAGSNLPINRVVIHSTSPTNWSFPETSQAGTARGTALYFTQQLSGGSAHYVEDVAAEEHCVAEAAVAQHAPPNTGSIGIEICASPEYTTEQWLSAEVWPAVLRAAQRTADVCDRHSLPKVKIDAAGLVAGARGVCGHADVSQAWHQTDHTDPGPNFPWPEFLAAVNQGDAVAFDKEELEALNQIAADQADAAIERASRDGGHIAVAMDRAFKRAYRDDRDHTLVIMANDIAAAVKSQ